MLSSVFELGKLKLTWALGTCILKDRLKLGAKGTLLLFLAGLYSWVFLIMDIVGVCPLMSLVLRFFFSMQHGTMLFKHAHVCSTNVMKAFESKATAAQTDLVFHHVKGDSCSLECMH